MRKRLVALSLALMLSAPLGAHAGSGGDSNTTTTTTNTTSSSTSSSTSTSNTYTTLADKYMGAFDLGYTVNGYAYETGNGSARTGWITYSYNNYRTGIELLTQGPAYRASGDANAWQPHVYLPDRCASLSTSTSQSRQTSVLVVPTDTVTGQSTKTTTQTTYQTTQQKTTQTVYSGDIVLAENTNINTNVNENVNTNVETIYDHILQNLTGKTTYTIYTVTQAQYVSPIVLDLSGSGRIDASGGTWLPHGGVKGNRLAMFDIRGNGFEMAVEWLGPNQGLLFEPRQDGTVDGTCLFGQASGYSDGFQKLSLRDKNSDGRLTGTELKGLHVWVDRNSNARLDKGEVLTVEQLKISEIGCSHRAFKSSFVVDGKREAMWDWFPTALDVQKVAHVTKR